jgi:carboxyl-terminal processing protease
LKYWQKNLVTLLLAFCVVVTIAVGCVFASYPREVIDFVQVMYLVKKDFRDPLSLGHMLDGATAGLAEAADDRYTYYLTPDRNRAVAMASRGYTGTIGVTVEGEKTMEDRLLIREVRPDSGADQAGLLAGDEILQVEDTPIMGLTVDEAVAMIRGEPETWVRLLIAREGEDDREYRVKRMTTVLETARGMFLRDDYMPGRKIAYIYIDYFASNTWQLFNDLLDGLLEDGAEALIIDLRFNGGGDVAATSRIAGRLLPEGELMRLVMREEEQRFTIQDAHPISIPYVILVNGGSASASEILAGVVQDMESGLLVGTRTYGKGSVQSLYNLNTGSGLRVTEGRYYLPSGRCIDGEGIYPDFEVEYDPDDEQDNQIVAALRLLQAVLEGDETVESLLLAKSPLRKVE